MSADWKAELEKMKKEPEGEIAKKREAEEKLRKKYAGDKKKLIDLIHSQLIPVVETFKDEDMDETDQPKIRKYQMGIALYLPIVSHGTHLEFSITFGFNLTDNGYAVITRKTGYDHVQDRPFTSEGRVEAPVTVEGIQNEISAFIRDRNFVIEMLDEKARRMKRRLA